MLRTLLHAGQLGEKEIAYLRKVFPVPNSKKHLALLKQITFLL